MRMLVAEDDAAPASFVKGLNRSTARWAFRLLGSRPAPMAGEPGFDLVVHDLNLPRMEGVTIPGLLRTGTPSTAILVLTGRNRVEDRVQCLDLGAEKKRLSPD